MKVNFVVRRTKKKVDGKVPIEMTICVKGKRRYVSTGREVKPSDFSSKTQTALLGAIGSAAAGVRIWFLPRAGDCPQYEFLSLGSDPR